MANSFFAFKQFIVHQQHCAMKVGTDGVLLGAWANCANATDILDVGTGSGLISLMLAQRFQNVVIRAVELEKSAALQAASNVAASKWSDRITVFHSDFLTFNTTFSKKYDVIISNLPFFNNSLKNNNSKKAMARHSDDLPYEKFIAHASKMLNRNGKIMIILPIAEAQLFERLALNYNLFCCKKTEVVPVIGKQPNRYLMEFSENKSIFELTQITIEKEIRHSYTNEFIELMKDFYLYL